SPLAHTFLHPRDTHCCLLPYSPLTLCPVLLFFPKVTTTPPIDTLSLHDALPIYRPRRADPQVGREGQPQTGARGGAGERGDDGLDRKSTRLNSSHVSISYAVFCLKKKTS